jgi:hypothetical protein
LFARVLDHAAVLEAGECHLERHLAREYPQRDARAVAGRAPGRPWIEADEPRPVGGLGDVVEALVKGDAEPVLDFDADDPASRLTASG